MSKTIVIYDGDILSYRASAVIETRTVVVTHEPTQKQKVFKNRTDFKNSMKIQEKLYNALEYTFVDKQESQPISNCIAIMKHQIENINDSLFADEHLICLSGVSNFRDTLPLPSKYKGSRVGLMRPVHLKGAKTYLKRNYPSQIAVMDEADDVQIYKGYEYLEKGYTVILATIDKDSFSYSGLNLYDFTADNPKVELIPFGVGYLEDTGKKITGRGLLWYCFQMIRGDTGDDYLPYELTGLKFGEKGAYKVLSDCKTEKEALTAVVNQYKLWYPSDFTYTTWDGVTTKSNWKHMLNLYHSCVRMKETSDDLVVAYYFYKKHGVNLNE